MNEEKNENMVTPKEIVKEEIPNTLQDDSHAQHSSGPVVGIVIIVILLIVGGIYFWFSAKNYENNQQPPTIQSGGETDAVVNQLNAQSSSDNISDIEKDLNATDLGNLDSESNDLLNSL